MSIFADRLVAAIEKSDSYLIAGFDPVLSTFPSFVISEANKESGSNEDFAYTVLTKYYFAALEALGTNAAAIKPNIAFFEQYGIGGMRAFVEVCAEIKKLGLQLVVDAKRGDIGTTAKAYSSAYLGGSTVGDRKFSLVDADALTVNPYLGFDTLEPFLEDCATHGRGVFVLVKTSNPGSSDIQNFTDGLGGDTVIDRVCRWIENNAKRLEGSSGFSGLGAVVGATYSEEARRVRERLPTSLFLVPGFGAQGGTASEAMSGSVVSKSSAFAPGRNPGGVIVNASRGLFQGSAQTWDQFKDLVRANSAKLKMELMEGARGLVA